MKRIFGLIISVSLLLTLFVGCNNSSNTGIMSNTTSTTEASIDIVEQENPSTEFHYEETDSGEIIILGYIGTDPTVVIPHAIVGKPVTAIEMAAFRSLDFLESVKMPNSIKSIGPEAFAYCPKLQTVIFSNSLEKIYSAAFQNCLLLSDIVLPSSLNSIGGAAFANCQSLRHINIPGDCLNNGSWEAFYNSGLESVEFQEGVVTIPESCFRGTHLKKITLPDTVKKISTAAFSDCSNLQTIVLNEGLETIESSAFSMLPSLVELTVPSTVTSISEYSFIRCENFSTLKFQGNAPTTFLCESELLRELFAADSPIYTIYFHEGATGFTSPEWNGYPTTLW